VRADREAGFCLDHPGATELLDPGVAAPVLDENLDFLVALADFHGPQVIPFSNHEFITPVVSGRAVLKFYFDRRRHTQRWQLRPTVGDVA